MTDHDGPTDLPVPAEPPQGAGPGGLDLGALLGAAQNMQSQMMASQERIAATVVEGQAGGGAVTVAVTGAFEFQRVTIGPDAVDPDDHSMLEDLILAALRDAAAKVAGLQAEANPLAGLGDGLGGLGGLFGGT
ncbi:MAG: YbaB/EbfC family nucleoid-associated protein [Acidimicrobiales bacterium]